MSTHCFLSETQLKKGTYHFFFFFLNNFIYGLILLKFLQCMENLILHMHIIQFFA